MSSAERRLQEEPKREKGSTRSDTLVQGLGPIESRGTQSAPALCRFFQVSLKERNAAFVTAAAVSSCSDGGRWQAMLWSRLLYGAAHLR